MDGSESKKHNHGKSSNSNSNATSTNTNDRNEDGNRTTISIPNEQNVIIHVNNHTITASRSTRSVFLLFVGLMILMAILTISTFISENGKNKFGFLFRQYTTTPTTKTAATARNKNNKNTVDDEESKWNALWDAHGPPVKLPPGKTLADLQKEQRQQQQPHDHPLSTVIAPADSSSSNRRGPAGDNNNNYREAEEQQRPKYAFQALQCRESVINFVINATDAKDECDGLIKAFDKTCSETNAALGTSATTTTVENIHNQNTQQHHHSLDKKNKQQPSQQKQKQLHPPHHHHHHSRTLSEKLRNSSTMRYQMFWYYCRRDLERFARGVFHLFVRAKEMPFWFAEDEVCYEWDEARFLVQHDWTETYHKQTRSLMQQRTLEKQQQQLNEPDELDVLKEKEIVEASETENANENDSKDKPVTTSTSTMKAAMQLPIKAPHVSEKNVNDALLLQQAEQIIKVVNETLQQAQEDAAKSKKAVTDTANAVSAIFNDPTSIEARTCCVSILNVYQELCRTDEEEQVSDVRLFFVVIVMAACGMVKSLIRHFKILWLPEAAGCILVGVISGYVLMFFPHHDFSFDGNWFLRILVPPIVFEAALSIDKRSFNRHIVPIIIFSVVGTLVSTYLTAIIVHFGSSMLSGWCAHIPYVESLAFGALISSIDPIATLSVLSNMGMVDTDTIYVLIFGESLLNDGVAIVLFHTLVHFLDENLIIDREAVSSATIHFLVVAFGSVVIGIAFGMISTVYFWSFYGCQTPLVEVLMFFCFLFFSYYICDGIGWSGIVAAVAVGFFMDVNVVGEQKQNEQVSADISEHSAASFDSGDGELVVLMNGKDRSKPLIDRSRRKIFNRHGHLSTEARTHIGFVTEIVSTAMETAIFAYLGFFLFSHRYHWNFFHAVLAIFACCLSRAIMIPSLSFVANWITRIQQRAACRRGKRTVGVLIDKKMQIVLWIAGLRGAMSFALVEHIPLYDSFSGEGTRLKPELKAMTSASIMFTVFILGGYTNYMMQSLGIAPSSHQRNRSVAAYEVVTLTTKGLGDDIMDDEDVTETADITIGSERGISNALPGKAFRRQRVVQHGTAVLEAQSPR